MAAALLLAGCAAPPSGERLLLGTTHTLQDSGLAEELTAAFSAAHPEHRLSVVVAGSGEVLGMAARGDFDVILTHSPEDETAFMAAGHGHARHRVMHNDFVLLAPPADPAGLLGGVAGAAAALQQVAAADATFVSRGDDSGTHRKERALWAEAGVLPEWSGYLEAGVGMAEVLRLASQRGAYTLSDRATYEVLRHELQLRIAVEDERTLRNQYSVIVPTRARSAAGARIFSDWLRSEAAQSLIGEYGRATTGRPLFIPANP
jgi:tungstate transport system substrate-binding protein